MILNENTSPIGMSIVSITLGVGTISGVEQIQEGGPDFYIVDFGSVNSKSYIPQTKSKKNRFVSEEKEFKKSLKVLKTDSDELKFDTKLERQKYFSSVLDNCDLDTVVDRVFKISTLKDITPNEKTKLKKLRNLLESEASVVLNTTSAKGKAFIADYISK